ncbi:MAG: DegV family EDD domain-containing protein, partial [Actinomycetia bacterium]|nr:DegV family EDD domain-containing protein [Actinomycetes bacterium]
MEDSYAIVADGTCDLSPEIRERFGVDGYLKNTMSTPEAEDVEGRLDLSDDELDAFYTALKANKDGYKTAAPSVGNAVSFFETWLRQGRDVLALSISSGLSASYNVLVRAKEELEKKYPERKVVVVDSLKYSVALGLLTIKACELRAAGLTLEDNAARLEEIRMTIHQIGSVDDLFWVASKGRISHAQAFFGTIAGIKAMGDFGPEGLVVVLAKVSGYEKMYKAAIEYIKRTIRDPHEQIIMVAHTLRRDQAAVLASKIREEIRP